jgi:hypothetical protein
LLTDLHPVLKGGASFSDDMFPDLKSFEDLSDIAFCVARLDVASVGNAARYQEDVGMSAVVK